MALVQCKYCRRAFISAPRDRDFCPKCTARLRELYPAVRGFLRDHQRTVFTIQDLSDELNIDVKDIKSLVALGLIDSI